MKNQFRIIYLLFAIAIVFTAGCGGGKQENTEENTEPEVESPEITVNKVDDSPKYETSKLSMVEPMSETLSPGTINFKFEVSDYELGVQTADAETKGLANSGKGQHIHFIVNNGPYSAHYEPEFEKEMEEGNYVVLAFLSRSYHESVKNQDAFVIKKFVVGDPEPMEVDFTAPHLFYSRPKGTYSVKDTDKLLLDFYLLNTSLSPDGNKVKATINGETFLLDDWAPYHVEGLPKGEVTIKLELIDAEGTLIPGPFNSVERTVKLTEAA